MIALCEIVAQRSIAALPSCKAFVINIDEFRIAGAMPEHQRSG
jgi:hypothetical protein